MPVATYSGVMTVQLYNDKGIGIVSEIPGCQAAYRWRPAPSFSAFSLAVPWCPASRHALALRNGTRGSWAAGLAEEA